MTSWCFYSVCTNVCICAYWSISCDFKIHSGIIIYYCNEVLLYTARGRQCASFQLSSSLTLGKLFLWSEDEVVKLSSHCDHRFTPFKSQFSSAISRCVHAYMENNWNRNRLKMRWRRRQIDYILHPLPLKPHTHSFCVNEDLCIIHSEPGRSLSLSPWISWCLQSVRTTLPAFKMTQLLWGHSIENGKH